MPVIHPPFVPRGSKDGVNAPWHSLYMHASNSYDYKTCPMLSLYKN